MSGHQKRRVLLAGVAASAVLAGGSAFAADLSAKAPVYKKAPVSTVYDWTGCYLGVHAGGGTQVDAFTPGAGASAAPAAGGIGGGGLAGGQVGCDAQIGQIVLGIEGEAARANLLDKAFGNEPLVKNATARERWSDEVALRAGVAIDRALVFGKVGVGPGRLRLR
jgi:outer membrane immunogenic protein